MAMIETVTGACDTATLGITLMHEHLLIGWPGWESDTAARAHRATSVPITTHTDEGSMGREQLATLAREGVDPSRVVIGHSCGSADLRYHVDLLDQGATLAAPCRASVSGGTGQRVPQRL